MLECGCRAESDGRWVTIRPCEKHRGLRGSERTAWLADALWEVVRTRLMADAGPSVEDVA